MDKDQIFFICEAAMLTNFLSKDSAASGDTLENTLEKALRGAFKQMPDDYHLIGVTLRHLDTAEAPVKTLAKHRQGNCIGMGHQINVVLALQMVFATEETAELDFEQTMVGLVDEAGELLMLQRNINDVLAA